MKTDNLKQYFDALRNDPFLFSRNDASITIHNNQSVKSKFSNSGTVTLIAVFVVLLAISSFILLTKYDRNSIQKGSKYSRPDKISKLPTEALRSPNSSSPSINPDQKTAIASLKKGPSTERHITSSINSLQPEPLNNSTLPSFNVMLSDIPNSKREENVPFSNNNSKDVNKLIANSFIPQEKNYFATFPSPLLANIVDGDFRIPDISNWEKAIGSISCSSTENMKLMKKLTITNAAESLDSIKLMVCSPDEYAQLGIHKTREGVFIVMSDYFINCYNKHASYSQHEMIGQLKAPIPVLVTDEDGTSVRSYFISDKKINLIKDSSEKLWATAAFDPLKALMSTMNTLIPVLVRNDLDTSQGIHSSNIIVWYDPESIFFKGFVPEDLMRKMMNGNYVQTIKSEEKTDASTIAAEKTNRDMASGDLTIWSDFKVYPNPVCVEFNLAFKLTDNKILKINLFDIHGRKVKILKPERLEAIGDLNYEFNISELPTGMYILAVESSTGELWTQRIIKQ